MKDSHSTGFILPVERKGFGVKTGLVIITIIMIILSLLFVVPILWVILSAFKDTKEFLTGSTFLPATIDLGKVAFAWKQSPLGRAYFWTVVMVLGQLFFMLIFNGLAGFVLSRLKPKGVGFVFALVMWTMMMPGTLGMVPSYVMWVKMPVVNWIATAITGVDFQISTLNTYWSMWIPCGCSCFNCILFKGFFDGISNSYVEAARIDGCSEIGIFTKIIMPLSRPVMMTVAIFTITGGWGNFMWPYIIIKDTTKVPIGVAIYTLSKNSAVSADIYMMMLTFVILPPLIFFLFFQKYIMEGMNLGGIKG